MTPADCNSFLSDADPPVLWSYRYSTAEECLAVKQEPEWNECGESEAASWASLYADHDVKDEIVFGPEQFQPQDIAISMQHALIKTEEDPCMMKLADEERTEHVCSPLLSREPETDKTHHQLTYCFVRLERITSGEQNTTTRILESSSLTDKPFKCNICQKQFKGQGNLTNHIKSHRDYSCHICQKKFVYPYFLTAHMELHKAKPEQSSELNKHMLDHTIKPYPCNICQKRFKSKQYLYTHRYQKHPHDSKRKPHLCMICPRRFVHKGSLNTHYMHHHKNDKQYDYLMTKLTHQPSSFTKHMLDQIRLKPYPCNICQVRFRTKQYLYTHRYKHHPYSKTKPHLCKICRRRFVHKVRLNTHYMHHHKHDKQYDYLINKLTQQPSGFTKLDSNQKQKTYSWNICKKKNVTIQRLHTHNLRMRCKGKLDKKKLNNHEDDHMKEKPHCCVICQTKFVYRKSLLTHMRMRHPKANELTYTQNHDKEKPHCCTICQRRFVYRKTLLTHMRVRHPKSKEQLPGTQGHGKEKPHCCASCQTKFVYRKTLLTHMRMRHPKANQLAHTQDHEKEKPHCCTICQSRFIYRNTLLTHMRRRHQKPKESNKQLSHVSDLTREKPHCCNVCRKRFVYRKSLITHMWKHPGSKPDTRVTHMRLRYQKVNDPNKQLAHNQDLSEEKPHCCKICQRRFVYRKTLLTHMRKHPRRKLDTLVTKPSSLAEQKQDEKHEKAHCRKICQRRLVYRKTLLSHMQLRHQNVNEPNQQLTQNQKVNESNNQQIASPSTSTKHEQDHAKEKPHCCKICQRRFVYRKTLLTHMRKHPRRKPDTLVTQPSSLAEQKQDERHEKAHCCKVCQRRFLHRKTLLSHMQLRHQNVNESNEKLAQNQTVNEDNNQQITPPNSTKHEKDHAEEKLHCCDICQKRFVYIRALLTHMRRRHKKLKECDKQLNLRMRHPKVNEQIANTQSLVKEKPHRCDICKKRFVYRKTLLTHMRLRHQKVNDPNKQLAHNQDLSEEKPHSCKICQRRFVYRKTLLTHMRKHPRRNPDTLVTQPSSLAEQKQDERHEKAHCCKVCQRRFLHRKTLLSHMQLRHQNVNESNEQLAQNQAVNEDNNQQITPPNSTKHEEDHAEEKLHCCDICQKRFVYIRALLTHMRRRHPKANAQVSNMQSHKKEKPHHCDICQKRFVYRKSLLTHMRRHTTGKPHSCSVCPKRFVYKKTLLTHMRLRHKKDKEPDHQQITPPLNASEQDHTKEKPHSCSVCPKRFVYKKTLLTHMRLRHKKDKEPDHQQITPPLSASEQDHTKEKPHSCSVCPKRFMYKKTLLTHMRLRHKKDKEPDHQQITPPLNASEQDHTTGKPHSCSVCPKRFMYKKTLLTHMRLRHKKDKEPDHQQITPPLNATVQDHTKEKPHSCSVCPKRFVYKKTLLTHMRLRHKKDKEPDHQQITPPLNATVQDHTKEKPHSCSVCPKRFVYKKTLLTHMRLRHKKDKEPDHQQITPPLNATVQDHTKEKPHSCSVCPKRFMYKKTLLTHMRLRHKKDKEPDHQQITPPLNASEQDHTKEKPHSCSVCPKRFRYKKTLLTHMRLRHQKASELDKELTSSSTKHKHEKDHAEEKRHCCDICQKGFVYKKALLTHMQRHIEDKPNETLVPPSSISVHTDSICNNQTHTQEKLYTCDICERQFAHKITLDNHLRLHSAVKPYWCNVCNKRFTELDSLAIHRRIHTAGKPSLDSEHSHTVEKPFSCNLCREQFADLDGLIIHAQKWHTEEKIFRCNVQGIPK